MHPAVAIHGDLGMVMDGNIVLAISRSGGSEETLRMLPNLKLIGAKILSICSNSESNLAKNSDLCQVLPRTEEACPLNLAPNIKHHIGFGIWRCARSGAFKEKWIYTGSLLCFSSRSFTGEKGTLTDGRIHIGEHGELFNSFDVKGGLGIRLLQEAEIVPAIITGRSSGIALQKVLELNIHEVYQGISDKDEILRLLADKYSGALSEIAYIGDNINDLPAFTLVGLSFAPADAHPLVKGRATRLCPARRGEGAVREAIEMILRRRECG